MEGLPVSLTLLVKMTLLPSFHISVMMVWPGSTVPAKRTLMFLMGPNLCVLRLVGRLDKPWYMHR